jgi:hypothetical protein
MYLTAGKLLTELQVLLQEHPEAKDRPVDIVIEEEEDLDGNIFPAPGPHIDEIGFNQRVWIHA